MLLAKTIYIIKRSEYQLVDECGIFLDRNIPLMVQVHKKKNYSVNGHYYQTIKYKEEYKKRRSEIKYL